mgnify:CR=1 FL=1
MHSLHCSHWFELTAWRGRRPAAALPLVPLQGETCELFTVSVYNPAGATEATALSAICQQNLKVAGSDGKGEERCCRLAAAPVGMAADTKQGIPCSCELLARWGRMEGQAPLWKARGGVAAAEAGGASGLAGSAAAGASAPGGPMSMLAVLRDQRDRFRALMLREPSVIKRPVVEWGPAVTVGFDAADWSSWVNPA